eukprot:MONOS_5176.1-p1 / transcript=MONOS_5176.1 / gene=MONOS_5176 / organism=Monocercomonoides_exilis_PA203 / gene_product=Protein kinase domain containing protein / transcript_product=Protein kinase domain containing protein / location=Mono_scaffold00148:8619-9485(-) / protein_length=288 / sequence_SO=supercontig / SO=protein_coding / is_pseudo=false
MNEIQNIIHQILEALVFVHSLGVIHSDVQPENILVSFAGHQPYFNVFLSNFHHSRFFSDPPNFDRLPLSHTPPEEILGHESGQKSDLWSVGCLAAELFLGYPLFEGSFHFHIDNIERYVSRSERVFAKRQDLSVILLSEMISLLGDIPIDMLDESLFRMRFFSRSCNLYTNTHLYLKNCQQYGDEDSITEEDHEGSIDDESSSVVSVNFSKPQQFHDDKGYAQHIANLFGENDKTYYVMTQRKKFREAIPSEDVAFLDFIGRLLVFDENLRPTAREALNHPWFRIKYS